MLKKEKWIAILFVSFLSVSFAQSKLTQPTIKTIDWGAEGAPNRISFVSHNAAKTCYDVIGFYPDAAKSFSVKYDAAAKDKKWFAKWGAWECKK